MAGHSKWKNIQNRKNAQDAKRGKVFQKLAKEIYVAAKSGGGDPDTNPGLRLVIEKAKSANMPNDNIKRAIDKAAGNQDAEHYEEIIYEGYGPGGAAVMVLCLTDNKNRTVAEVRHVFSKGGGTLGESGSVAWMFERKGIITLPKQGKSEDDIMEIILDAGADDLQTEDDFFEIQTSLESFEPVRRVLAEKNFSFENASLQWIAQNSVKVSGEDAEKVIKLIEALEDLDDVQNVYSNADFDEETISKSA